MTSHHQRPVLPVPDAVRTRGATLPDELLARATVRLRLTALVTMAVSAFRVVMGLVGDPDKAFGTEREVSVKLAFFGLAAAVSAVLFGLSYARLSHRRFLLVGQVFFVLLVAILGATEATAEFGEHPYARGLPMPIGIILMFPVIVPMPPRRYLIVALIAVATVPLVTYLVPPLVGHAPPSTTLLLLPLIPLIIAALVAAVTARVIYQLGRELGRAQKMGSYQLVAPLGKGGMGEVWRAKHGMLAREAAVKLIRSDRGERGSEEALERFEHEAKVVASLRSPHTIQLYDFGVTDDGALYYAMELLDGMDLDRLVTMHGPIPPERVVHFMVQACHSLVEAHEVGLVHRDIKPANIFATRNGRDVDVIKVLDFGLATKPVAERIPDARVTHEGTIIGTPAYMAPEQVLGDATIDGRADLYTLGLVAWFLLTGRDVFQATSATQVMFAHVHVEPEAPSLHAKMPIPPELEAVILKCLAKKREDRPATAEVLANALRAIPFATPWTRERALAWWATHGAGPASEASTKAAAIADTHASPLVG